MSRAKKPQRTPATGRVSLVWGIPLSLLSGCLVFLSFPTFDLFPLQWISLVPLLVAARGRTARGGFFLGFLAGLSTNLGGFYWISHVLREFGHMQPGPAWGLTVLVNAYQALTFAAATALAAHLATRFERAALWTWVFPIAFTACEHLIPFIFPWYFANGQQRFYAVTQVVEWTGVAGLTFLLVFVNAAVAAAVSSRLFHERFPVFRVVVASLAFFAAVGYGVVRIPQVDQAVAEGRRFRVAVVEPDIGVWEKEARGPDGADLPWPEQLKVLYRNLLKHHILSANAEQGAHPDLIVWPESSYLPLHEVYWRSTDFLGIASGSEARVAYLTLDGDLRLDSNAATEMRATGVRAVAAGHERFLLAVGARGASYVGDDTRWTREPTGVDRDLLGVAVSPRTDRALAVGAQGTMVLRENAHWRSLESGVTVDLRAATAAGPDTFVAAGDRGTVLVVNGTHVSQVATGTESDLLAVSFAPGAGLWVVGRDGVALHGDLHHLERQEVPFDRALVGVVAGVPAFLLGEGDALFECGGACRALKAPRVEALRAIASDGTGGAFVLGSRGGVLRLQPSREPERIRDPKGPEGLRTLSFVPFLEGYPLPRGVTALRIAETPLPSGGLEDLEKLIQQDESTPDRDRNAAMRGFRTPLLLGVITAEQDPERPDEKRYYNTALLLDRDGRVLGRYDKNYLLIFGEYLPFSDLFPFLKRWFPESGDFRPGRTVEVFDLHGTRIGVMICYEDIIPAFTRRLHEKNPDLLVNITNDAWFGHTTEPYQHLGLATFRAIENRRFLVRARTPASRRSWTRSGGSYRRPRWTVWRS